MLFRDEYTDKIYSVKKDLDKGFYLIAQVLNGYLLTYQRRSESELAYILQNSARIK